MPLVVQLTDDDGDGTIDARDVPDVVAITHVETFADGEASEDAGHLTALSGDDGRLLWQSPASTVLCSSSTPAAGDLDGDGTIEIVAIASSGSGICGHPLDIPGLPFRGNRVAAFSHTGELEWRNTTEVGAHTGAVAIADLDGDGSPEIVAGGTVLSSTGAELWEQHDLREPPGLIWGVAHSIADLDADPELEIVDCRGGVAYHHDGTVLWRRTLLPAGFTAVAHVLDASPGPQIVAVNGTTFAILDGATGAPLLGPVTYAPGAAFAGPPTVADFDGDGRPEIGVAGDDAFVVLDPDLPAPHVRWSLPSEDVSTGSVGSTVFDFDADGAAEVVYGDECQLRILAGGDGRLLWHEPSTSWTSLEYPVVADVDSDGNAEIVVVSNRFLGGIAPSCSGRSLPFTSDRQGVRVLRDRLDNWVATRSIWNQHTYHVDNVTDDGAIPAVEGRSWESHNTYRLNTLADPAARTLAPDLVIASLDGVAGACAVSVTLRARVENRGSRGVAAGVPVAFYAGSPPDATMLLGVARTTRTLLAGAGEWVELEILGGVPLDAMLHLTFWAAVDDDGARRGTESECDEANNEAPSSLVLDCSVG
jgi:outer membrane protein assembly factor BamB